MTERAETPQPNLNIMEFVPAKHQMDVGETLVISGYGVPTPEVTGAAIETDVGRWQHGLPTVSIDMLSESKEDDRIEIRDVNNTPWVDEDTGERGNFLAAHLVMGTQERLVIHQMHRLRPGQTIGFGTPAETPAAEGHAPNQQTTAPLSLGIDDDGKLVIAQRSFSHTVSVRNLGQTGQLIRRSASLPAAEAEAPKAEATEQTTGSGLPRRTRQPSAIGASAVSSEAQVDASAGNPPASRPKHALDELLVRADDVDRLGSARGRRHISTILIPNPLANKAPETPKNPEEN